jgi:hypothetical protein
MHAPLLSADFAQEPGLTRSPTCVSLLHVHGANTDERIQHQNQRRIRRQGWCLLQVHLSHEPGRCRLANTPATPCAYRWTRIALADVLLCFAPSNPI